MEDHYTSEAEKWLQDLAITDRVTYRRIRAAIKLLALRGPALGRPVVDKISHSEIHNLKELRPGSAGRTEVRILFVFDPRRQAILLVAGDKSGEWDRWYRDSIPLAEERYRIHLSELGELS